MASSPRPRRFSRSAFAALIACACSALPVAAQEYKTLTNLIDAKKVKAIEPRVYGILRDTQAPNAEAQGVLKDYFQSYFFAMTPVDDIELGKLGERRVKLFQQFLNTAKSPATRDFLNTTTLQAMSSISKSAYHPAVRYNAVLVIGQLDQELGAKPLPAATDALISLLETDQPTAVKVAALLSLGRHTKLAVDPAMADRITKAALGVATRKDIPKDTSAKAYGWVRRQAAQVLANQSAKGLTPAVHDALTSIIADDKSELDDRCGVAAMLQPPIYEGGKGLNGDAMALALGGLATKVLSVESKAAGKYLDAMLSGGMSSGFGEGGRGGAMYGGYGGRGGEGGGFGAGGLEPPDLTSPRYEKRNMLKRTKALVEAANAVKTGGSDELKARMDKFATAITTVAQLVVNEETPPATVAEEVVGLSQEIDKMVAAWTPAEGPSNDAGPEIEVPADAAPAPAASEPRAAEAAGG